MKPAPRRRFVPAATRRVLPLAALLALLVFSTSARAATPVNLGTATGFAVLASGAITNGGSTTITGDVGVSPGTTMTDNGTVTLMGASATYLGDPIAAKAQTDLDAAYMYAEGVLPDAAIPADLGNKTLTPGVYYSAAAFAMTGPLVLDGDNDLDPLFIFQTPAALNTTAGTAISLINGANVCNVFWQVGGAVTLGGLTDFKGTIMGQTAISLGAGATIEGRALALDGDVTMDSNIIDAGACDAPTTTALTLAKTVVNDDGGTATAGDWTLSAGAYDVTGSAAGALATNQAGTYALSESGPDGYTAGAWSCTGGQTGSEASVTLGFGDTITCTIVNNDIAPTPTPNAHPNADADADARPQRRRPPQRRPPRPRPRRRPRRRPQRPPQRRRRPRPRPRPRRRPQRRRRPRPRPRPRPRRRPQRPPQRRRRPRPRPRPQRPPQRRPRPRPRPRPL